MVKSWLFDIFNYPHDPRPEGFDPELAQEEFDWHLETWTGAEELGYDGIFFSEHHFTAYNMSPSPNLLVSAVAQRTNTMHLGVMCNVTAFHHPRRLAEETAMLDYLTHGRLEVGLGRGADDLEFKKEGFPLEDTRAWFEESLELMHQAWEKPRFTHHGRFFDYQDTALYPRPLHQPRVWITALSPSTVSWAAAKGYRMAISFLPASGLADMRKAYDEAARAAGRTPTADDVAMLRNVFVADTDEQAREIAEPALDHVFRLYKEAAVPEDVEHMAKGYEAYSSFFRPFVSGGGVTFEDLQAAGIVIVGSPESVRDQLVAQTSEVGCGHLLNWFSFGALTKEQTQRSVELFAKEVAPALRAV
ncbi:LLM class flavin-dependent oxidoreductase [Amycolatopsis jejuensis]|uniref:LLM class flavin-dependent oxidoreductase n=1 Tax=Amycolatopsis jejuensis TaxID=330084 RepID=UPI0005249D75|nr:LLM class flavin-dependent oxidoreductase [Amycolatopsis jejuensis]